MRIYAIAVPINADNGYQVRGRVPPLHLHVKTSNQPNHAVASDSAPGKRYALYIRSYVFVK